MSYNLKLVSNETIEITDEEAETLKTQIEQLTSISVQGAWIRTSAIMAILPSKKNDPNYQKYLNDKNNYNYRGSFESWQDEAGIKRIENDRIRLSDI